MKGSEPWELHPALTRRRLIAVAAILWKVRLDAARDAKWDLGDSPWSIGCVAYDRSCHALANAAVRPGYRDWLSVKQTPHRAFLIKIGGIPLRFYRGDPSQEVPIKYAFASPLELFTIQESYDLFRSPKSAYCRLVVEIDDLCEPISVTFCQVASGGDVAFNCWPIPVDEDMGSHALDDLREEAVEMPPPAVGDDLDEMDRRPAARNT